MDEKRYLSLIKDKVETILSTWNKEDNNIYNKVKLLKELIDYVAEYFFAKEGKDYSKQLIKYNIIVTNSNDYANDLKVIRNSKGREIVVLEEDINKKYELSTIMNKYVSKIIFAVSKGLKNPNEYYELHLLPDYDSTDSQIEKLFNSFDKDGNIINR